MTIDPTKSIPAFYSGQSIFLTGATGFLGKVFIEKVLRSCPDVCEIFLLMRPKRGSSINERLEEILNLPFLDKMTIDPTKSIPAFYSGQSIFLTGATGFLGKVFIEKVLRSCPDVREIFLLMRPKRGSSINKRLEEMLNLPLYNKLREERPSNFDKLIPIFGDVSEKELGLSIADRQMLVERVTIVIHAAGDVKFYNSLKYAIFVNTRATRDICILAQNMKNLIAMVYVSTAFANVNVPFIEEKTYPPIADWQKMIEMAETLDEHTLNIFTAKCLDYFPNTYIFTKNLAESVIQKYSSSLPCAIVRPAIVMASLKEPVPGWIDNIYGPIGISIGIEKGLIRTCWMSKSVIEKVVPVDIVVKAIIIVTWKLGLTTYTAEPTFIVLNCTNQKYLSHGNHIKLLLIIFNEIFSERAVWTSNVIVTDNFVLFYALTILFHFLPALLIDIILKFSGRRPKLLRLQRQLYVINCAVSYFTFYDWKFSTTNSLVLISSIPTNDRDTFSFEYIDCDIKEYLKDNTIGIKKFLIQEDVNRLNATYNNRVRLFVTTMKAVISIGILWLIYKWIYCTL